MSCAVIPVATCWPQAVWRSARSACGLCDSPRTAYDEHVTALDAYSSLSYYRCVLAKQMFIFKILTTVKTDPFIWKAESRSASWEFSVFYASVMFVTATGLWLEPDEARCSMLFEKGSQARYTSHVRRIHKGRNAAMPGAWSPGRLNFASCCGMYGAVFLHMHRAESPT
jgi:hypothetical protein